MGAAAGPLTALSERGTHTRPGPLPPPPVRTWRTASLWLRLSRTEGIALRTAERWVRRYRTHGLAGSPGSGAPIAGNGPFLPTWSP